MQLVCKLWGAIQVARRTSSCREDLAGQLTHTRARFWVGADPGHSLSVLSQGANQIDPGHRRAAVAAHFGCLGVHAPHALSSRASAIAIQNLFLLLPNRTRTRLHLQDSFSRYPLFLQRVFDTPVGQACLADLLSAASRSRSESAILVCLIIP